MDPATIFQVAGTALALAKQTWDTGAALYNFYQDVKKFDKTAEAFVGEVKALGTACELVSTRLGYIVKEHEKRQGTSSPIGTGGSGDLWKYLEEQLFACQKTIINLKEAVAVTDGAKDLGTFDKVIKQIKLNLKASDVKEARDLIRSHTASLQIVLTSIGIELTYILPQQVSQQLQLDIQSLAKKKQELEKLQTEPRAGTVDPGAENAVLEASKRIISGAESMFGDVSVGAPSLYGRPDPFKNMAIESWLRSADEIDAHRSALPSLTESEPDSVFSAAHNAASLTTNTTAPQQGHPDMEVAEQDQEVIPDSDDEEADYRLDIAKDAIAAGHQAFDSKNYEEASETLTEAMNLILELPSKQKHICDTNNIRYMLAVCDFHLTEASTARKSLVSVIEVMEVKTDEQRLRRLDLSHLLSQCCVRLGPTKLEEARLACQNAIKGRHRVVGKDSAPYYESLALMARIHELEGNSSRARLLQRSIPEQHSDLVSRFSELSIEHQGIMEDPVVSEPEPSPSVTEPAPAPDDEALSQSKSNREGRGLSKPVHTPLPAPQTNEGFQFQNPHLKAWAEQHEFTVEKPFTKAQRQKLINDEGLVPVTDLAKALIQFRDQDALALVGKSRNLRLWRSREKVPTLPDLHLASYLGVDAVIDALLKTDTDVNTTAILPMTKTRLLARKTALHLATENGRARSVSVLLKAGASVDVQVQGAISYERTSLAIAVQQQNPFIIDILLQYGAAPLADCGSFSSPLHLACTSGNLAIVKALDLGKDSSRSIKKIWIGGLGLRSSEIYLFVWGPDGVKRVTAHWMHLDPPGVAICAGHENVLQYFISQGWKPPEQYLSDRTSELSPLALAAALGQCHIVKILLATDLDIRDKDRALTCAAVNWRDDTACLLLDAGAKADQRTKTCAKAGRLTKFLARIEDE